MTPCRSARETKSVDYCELEDTEMKDVLDDATTACAQRWQQSQRQEHERTKGHGAELYFVITVSSDGILSLS